MTTAEFESIYAPYLTQDVIVTGYPEPFIHWQKFAVDLQILAKTERPSGAFLDRLEQAPSDTERPPAPCCSPPSDCRSIEPI